MAETLAPPFRAMAFSGYRLIARGANDDVVRLPPFPDLQIPLAEIWFSRRRTR